MTVTFPDGRYFMVMWNVAWHFGGMTGMCLRRARNLLKYAGINAPVLSFSLTGEYDALRASLVERGYLLPDNQLLNIWEYYRAADLGDRATVSCEDWHGRRPAPDGLRAETIMDSDGRLIAELLRDSANAIVYRQCFRPDGSTYFVDAGEMAAPGRFAKRRLWLIDRNGNPVAFYSSAGAFYHDWMDELTGGAPSTFIFDDKTAGNLLRRYQRPHVLMISPVHSNHIKSAGDPLRGELDPNRAPIFDEPWRWDSLVFLTERQYNDFWGRYGRATNLEVIPNPVDIPADPPRTDGRPPGRGIMVARLSKGKNIPVAIEAIRRAREQDPRITLDIYGQGEEEDSIRAVIEKLGLQDAVRLKGYLPGAADQYATAAFSLLTSRYEGFPLALIESLSRGCPPIAFDIRYGPADVIEDGVSGYVVPAGDVQAMADRIVALSSSDDLLRRMAEAGRRRATTLSDEAVTQRWSDLVARLWQDRRSEPVITKAGLNAELQAAEAGSVAVQGELSWQSDRPLRAADLELHLRVLGRSTDGPTDLPIGLGPIERSGCTFSVRVPLDAVAAATSPDSNSTASLTVVGAVGRRPVRTAVRAPRAEQPAWIPVVDKKGQLGLVASHAAFSTP